jgi:hypothetical protein
MKPFVRSILYTGILAIVAGSSMVAQTSNGWSEQWYRAKYGRSSPTEQARLKTPQVTAASLDAKLPPVVASANGGFEQWYRAKYGRPSPTEEARLETMQVNSASPEAALPAVAVSSNDVRIRQTLTMEHLSKHQLNTLIAIARTPAEPQRIAKFFKSQAQDYLAQSKEHAREAEQARNNPVRNNNKAVFSTVNHCEYFARKFTDLASKSRELAKQHEQMATDTGKQSGLQASSHFPTSESLGK